jgi:hypothetical protein
VNPWHLPTCPAHCGDHHFTGNQQAEYDSMPHRGRSLYDNLRYAGATHDQAFTDAVSVHGLKRVV